LILTFKYQLRPTASQERLLQHLLEEQRVLYNGALQERIECYNKTGKSLTKFDQYKSLTEWRQSDLEARSIPLNIQRWTVGRVDEAFKAFFRRVKIKGAKAGFPRFRSRNHWKSFGFNEFLGIQIKGNRLFFCDIRLRVHMHRPLLDGKITSCQFTKSEFGWQICIQVKTADQAKCKIETAIGIDVGITHLATTSDGMHIANARNTKRYEKELRRRQRAVSRCKLGSKTKARRRLAVARCHRKVVNTRNTYLHQISIHLIKSYDLIAVENLNIKGLAQSRLAKSIHDASWHKLIQYLSYKAARAGAHLIPVDPRYTSQLCSNCGTLVPKKLSKRVHVCDSCGLQMDRDVNAARNILRKAVVGLEIANVIRFENVRRSEQLFEIEALPDV
jgi:putative transposase